MPTTHYPSPADAEVVDVIFLKPHGGEEVFHLLVDSGFTGQSSFVLPVHADYLAHAQATPSQVAGALQGSQTRVVVAFRVDALAYQNMAIAILADTANLSLPDGVQGIAGLRFLRHFRRWGAEQSATGNWQFVLES